MIRVLAIDDEPLALRQLVTYIQRVPFLELAAQCRSALDAREFLSHDSVDAIFCDINMPDLDGMSFVKSLAAPPLVVFTTAYSEYAVEGFRVEAVDYLLKPFGLDEFRRSAERVRRRLQQTGEASVSSTPSTASTASTPSTASTSSTPSTASTPSSFTPVPPNKTLFIRADHRTIAIAIDSIRYVQGMGEYVRLHLTTNQKPVTTLLAMKVLEERLPQDSFMRIHRSYIIALSSIVEVAKNRVRLDDGTELPIGDAYRQTFETYLAQGML